MNRTLATAAALFCLVLASSLARAGNSSEIAAETVRTIQEGTTRVASFWWLPADYWIAAAKEMALPPADQEKVAKFFPNYLIVGVIDADVSEKHKPLIAGIAEIVARTQFTRDGQPVQVLREVSPDVADLVPKLVYLLKASMGRLGDGLRLLPLSNISEKGDPIITANKPGLLGVQFRFTEGGPVHELRWHAPLTAVVGPKRCPKDGEALDASWDYCPWHGVKLEAEPTKPKP
jgi:hypothetical protein